MTGAVKTTPDMITDITLKEYAGTKNERTKQILASLIKHLHSFAKDVKLTPDELIFATQFLAWGGQISDEKRHEFILLSDTLGLTMLVETLNDDLPEGAFEPSVLGPFYREGAPYIEHYDNISRGENDGVAALITGQVRNIDGEPLSNAELDIWQTNNNGLYENTDPNQPDFNLRGKLKTDKDGTYAFWTVRPEAYPIPIDGPVGKLLEAGGRHNMRPAHIHFIVSSPGYKTIVSEIFDREDEYLGGDAVFGVKDSLITDFDLTDDPETAQKYKKENPFYTMRYDFVLVPGDRAKVKFSAAR
ncbi:dioxygenase [Pseudahrensia aquimaris]|uniref:Dioxygenase n=1 Tax=Pseudahrensia aquimaris TaxID=744461 RepID=A0ABW3FG94_9HYPH